MLFRRFLMTDTAASDVFRVSHIGAVRTRSELFFLEKSEADFLERKLLPPHLDKWGSTKKRTSVIGAWIRMTQISRQDLLSVLG